MTKIDKILVSLAETIGNYISLLALLRICLGLLGITLVATFYFMPLMLALLLASIIVVVMLVTYIEYLYEAKLTLESNRDSVLNPFVDSDDFPLS